MNQKPERLPRIDEGRYAGQWVAIDPRTRNVVAEGVTFKEAKARAEGHGVADPLMHPVPKSDGYFIGAA